MKYKHKKFYDGNRKLKSGNFKCLEGRMLLPNQNFSQTPCVPPRIITTHGISHSGHFSPRAFTNRVYPTNKGLTGIGVF